MEETRQQNIRHEIPKDAVLMTRFEALNYQMDIIHKWKPQSEVWSVKFGRSLLIAAASFSGIYINHRFRRKLKLLNYGGIHTMLGLTVAPAVVTTIMHTEILNKVLLQEFTCSACLISRSMLYQCCSGLLMPLIMTPFANFAIAAGSGIYNVPHVTDVKGIVKVIRSTYSPMISTITLIFILHALLAGFLTYSQIKSIIFVQNTLYLLDQDSKQQSYVPSNF